MIISFYAIPIIFLNFQEVQVPHHVQHVHLHLVTVMYNGHQSQLLEHVNQERHGRDAIAHLEMSLAAVVNHQLQQLLHQQQRLDLLQQFHVQHVIQLLTIVT